MSKYQHMSQTVLVKHVQSCGSKNPSAPAPGQALIFVSVLCTLDLTNSPPELPKSKLHYALGFLKFPSHYSRKQAASLLSKLLYAFPHP